MTPHDEDNDDDPPDETLKPAVADTDDEPCIEMIKGQNVSTRTSGTLLPIVSTGSQQIISGPAKADSSVPDTGYSSMIPVSGDPSIASQQVNLY